MNHKQLGLDFAAISRFSRRNLLCFIVVLMVSLMMALNYIDIHQTVQAKRFAIKQREVNSIIPPTVPQRSVEETKAVLQEVNAVNKQIKQLNQRWDYLFNDLRAFPGGDIGALSLEVNAVSGVIRYVAIAPDIETMTDYAAYLADKSSLQAVLISRHEMDSRGLNFVVDAKWAEKL